MECPACQARDIRLDGGDDLTVDSFEMEDENEESDRENAKARKTENGKRKTDLEPQMDTDEHR